jgi:hypothetical protein
LPLAEPTDKGRSKEFRARLDLWIFDYEEARKAGRRKSFVVQCCYKSGISVEF